MWANVTTPKNKPYSKKKKKRKVKQNKSSIKQNIKHFVPQFNFSAIQHPKTKQTYDSL